MIPTYPLERTAFAACASRRGAKSLPWTAEDTPTVARVGPGVPRAGAVSEVGTGCTSTPTIRWKQWEIYYSTLFCGESYLDANDDWSSRTYPNFIVLPFSSWLIDTTKPHPLPLVTPLSSRSIEFGLIMGLLSLTEEQARDPQNIINIMSQIRVSLAEALENKDGRANFSHFLRASKDRVAMGVEGKAQADVVYSTSRICPIVGGDWPSTARFYDVIAQGCIPLILCDRLILPFPSIIDWRRAVLRRPQKDVIANATQVLHWARSRPDLQQRHDYLMSIRHRLYYTRPGQIPHKEDAFWTIMEEIAVKAKRYDGQDR